MTNFDRYIMDPRSRSYTLEMRCPKCEETYFCWAEEDYGHRFIEDAYCPKCHLALLEVGEADMGDKWDTDPRV